MKFKVPFKNMFPFFTCGQGPGPVFVVGQVVRRLEVIPSRESEQNRLALFVVFPKPPFSFRNLDWNVVRVDQFVQFFLKINQSKSSIIFMYKYNLDQLNVNYKHLICVILVRLK